MTPICPLLTIAQSSNDDTHSYVDKNTIECFGSRCAMWWPDSEFDKTSGRCGLTQAAQSFRDPALPPSPTPDAEGER